MRYGHGIALQQIVELTRQSYHEVPVGRLGPDRFGGLGVHTLNRCGNLTLIDVLERETPLERAESVSG